MNTRRALIFTGIAGTALAATLTISGTADATCGPNWPGWPDHQPAHCYPTTTRPPTTTQAPTTTAKPTTTTAAPTTTVAPTIPPKPTEPPMVTTSAPSTTAAPSPSTTAAPSTTAPPAAIAPRIDYGPPVVIHNDVTPPPFIAWPPADNIEVTG